MSQTIIEQQPLFDTLPVGQDVIFTVSNSSIVSAFTRVKFQAEVHISSDLPPNTALNTDVVGIIQIMQELECLTLDLLLKTL